MRLYIEADCSEHCSHADTLPRVPCGLCGGEPRTVIPVDSDNLYRFDPAKGVAMTESTTWDKTCTHCLRMLPYEMFAGHKYTTGGRQSWCRDCKTQAMRVYRKKTGSGPKT